MSAKVSLLGAVCLNIAAFAGLTLAPAQAQEAWPTKRVSLLIGYAPGGFADSVARIIGLKLSERLGQ
jgi:tripartite-type tricarboxylate transporter receptor subunit TctC